MIHIMGSVRIQGQPNQLCTNLAWVAAQLLIRIGGIETFQQFIGIPVIVKEQGRLSTLINDYIRRRNERNLIPAPDNTNVLNCIQEAVAGQANYIMGQVVMTYILNM